MEQLLEQVDKRYGMGGAEDGAFGRTIYDRPMINGIIQDGFEDDMVFMWDQIGKSFAQSAPGFQDKNAVDAGFEAVPSKLMMTDPSLTMSGGSKAEIAQSLKQRATIAEIAFEELKVDALSLIPSQLPMLLSELQYDGVVVDLGHEMTQIVPFQNGHASFHQANTFPVGGLCIDALFLEQLKSDFKDSSSSLTTQIPSGTRRSKFFGYQVRRHVKEQLAAVFASQKSGKAYSLPDGTKIRIEQNDLVLNGLECYLD